MASRGDALRAIEHFNGATLYGSRVQVSFVVRDIRDSFWRRRRGNLPTLPDPPTGNATVDAGITRVVEAQAVRSRRSVEGIVDDAKLSVLQTCAIGWVKEVIPIRVLA
ncbi:hypothetical protein V6N11_013505 [Hibiscus sabdariffa]|uniref:Uncharacterized protein n=2 Tax=Hibiscus sabdariffa TaxID=183260 RepID=A0ABR2NJL5_9ROSI